MQVYSLLHFFSFDTGGGPDNLTALEISRHGSNTTIRADIAIDCVKSQEYDVKWTFYGYENHEMKLINLNIPTDNTTITVPEFILPFGPIKVEINVSMTHRLFDHLFTVNETYLKVNVTNLTVEIMGGEEGLERHGRQVS